jgi:hypothetical protein
MIAGKLKVAFLIGKDDPGKVSVIARVAESPHVEVVAVLVDTAQDPPSRRWKNLKRNIRRKS